MAVRAPVMEFVEGDGPKAQCPLDQAWHIAAQIAGLRVGEGLCRAGLDGVERSCEFTEGHVWRHANGVKGTVVHKQPDLRKAPARVHSLLRYCLRKDPRKDLRDIGDAPALLEESRPAMAVVAAQVSDPVGQGAAVCAPRRQHPADAPWR